MANAPSCRNNRRNAARTKVQIVAVRRELTAISLRVALRGTRHKHLCGVCLKPGDTFPGGFYTEAMCEHCIATYGITPIQHCPYGVQLQEAQSNGIL